MAATPDGPAAPPRSTRQLAVSAPAGAPPHPAVATAEQALAVAVSPTPRAGIGSPPWRPSPVAEAHGRSAAGLVAFAAGAAAGPSSMQPNAPLTAHPACMEVDPLLGRRTSRSPPRAAPPPKRPGAPGRRAGALTQAADAEALAPAAVAPAPMEANAATGGAAAIPTLAGGGTRAPSIGGTLDSSQG